MQTLLPPPLAPSRLGRVPQPIPGQQRLVACALGVLSGGCVDYQVRPTAEPLAPVVDTGSPLLMMRPDLAPLAVVSPASIDLGVVCSTGTAEVSIENQGNAVLDILDIGTNSGQWIPTHAELPVALPPGGTLPIQLEGAPIDDLLFIVNL